MQSGAGAGGVAGGPQPDQFDPDQDNQDEDDQTVAQKEDRDDVRGREDWGEAGEYEERRKREEKCGAHCDQTEPACGSAVVERRLPPRV